MYRKEDLRRLPYVPAEYYRGKVDRVVVMNVAIDDSGPEPRFPMALGRDGMLRTPGGSKRRCEYYSDAAVRECIEETGRAPDRVFLNLNGLGIITNIRNEVYHIVTYFGERIHYFGHRRPHRQQPERLGLWKFYTRHQAEGFVKTGKLYPAFFIEIAGALDTFQIIKEDQKRISIPRNSAEVGSFLWYIHQRDLNRAYFCTHDAGLYKTCKR